MDMAIAETIYNGRKPGRRTLVESQKLATKVIEAIKSGQLYKNIATDLEININTISNILKNYRRVNPAAIAGLPLKGRPLIMTESKLKSARMLLEKGFSRRSVAAKLGISLPTLYKWIPAPVILSSNR